MRTIVTIEGIDDALESLRYSNKKTLKSRLVEAIREQYRLADGVDSVSLIDTDFLVKTLWDTGDDPALIRNRRKNFNSIKSSVNAELKRLYEDGKNKEGIIINQRNVFDMSEDAKSEFLESFTYGNDGSNPIPLDKITDVLNVINDFISNKDSGLENDDKFEQLKDLIKDLSGKVGLGTEDEGGIKYSLDPDAPGMAPAPEPGEGDGEGDGEAEDIEYEEIEEEDIDEIEGDELEDIEEFFEDGDIEEVIEEDPGDEPEDVEIIDDEEGDIEELDEEAITDDELEEDEYEEIEESSEDGEYDDIEIIEDDDDEFEEVPEEELEDSEGSLEESAEDDFDGDEFEEIEESPEDEEYDDVEIIEDDDDEFEEVPEEELEDSEGSLEESAEDDFDGDEFEEIEESPEGEEYDDVEIIEDDDDEFEEVPEEELEDSEGSLEESAEDDFDGDEFEEIEESPEDEEYDDVEIIEDSDDEFEEVPEEELEGSDGDLEEIAEDEFDGDEFEELEDDGELEEVEEAPEDEDVEVIDDAGEDEFENVEIVDDDEEDLEEIIEDDEDGLLGVEEGPADDDYEDIEVVDAPEEDDYEDIEVIDDDGEDAVEIQDEGDIDDDIEIIDEDDLDDDEYEYVLEDILEDYDTTGYTGEDGEDKAHRLADEFDKMLSENDRFYNQHLLIPGGRYITGNDSSGGKGKPQTSVTLPDFYFGKFPVTNYLFELFIEKTGYVTTAERVGHGLVYMGRYRNFTDENTGRKTLAWSSALKSEMVKGASWFQPNGPGSNLHGKRNHPVVQVSLEDAMAFSAWTGKRLPTEEEWEAAARTSEGYLLPWGGKLRDSLCNIESSALGDTTEVDKYKKADNKFGISDLIGNVLEWTGTRDSDDSKIAYIAKGGSWISTENIDLAKRFVMDSKTNSNILGFRCIAYSK